MTIGFTGTRNGMTEKQFHAVARLVRKFEPREVHHGACIGADLDFDEITYVQGCNRVIHPAKGSSYGVRTGISRRCESKPPLVRNRDIVDECTILLATPKGRQEELRSGTWSTVRYARRKNRLIFIVWPNGSIKVEIPK